MSVDVTEDVRARREEMVSLRRDLHAHPETAFREERTARLVAERLAAFGLEVSTGSARTGVTAVIQGNAPGPTLMLRADMDALPIQETSDRPYASRNPGVMHACGHDGHTAALVTVASILAERRNDLNGRVLLVFQRAEEIMGGASLMIEEGVMTDPPVDRVLGFHLWNGLPVGQVGVKPGAIFAAVDEIELVVKGTGGHGAMPHQTVDPIPVAAQVISALQSLISREKHYAEGAVLTIGRIQGGTAFNIIATEVEMKGTLRTFDEGLRRQILARIPEVMAGICAAFNAEFEFRHLQGCPAVMNDPEVADFVRRVATKVVGEANLPAVVPSTVGDDMALFQLRAPGCYFLVGSSNADAGLDAPHHSSGFDFDEDALMVAAETLSRATLEYLG
ncbi:MAG: M20 family metallopeptidase [Chloroflexota bacterium]|nr:M20 family metallopeptidase [Chloroflexota bacterium]